MTRLPSTEWWIALRLFAAVAACGQLGGEPAKTVCAWDAFKTLSSEDKVEKIASCSPEQQLDLYMRWRGATRPPNLLLLDSVARLGPRVLPIVVARFKATRQGLPKSEMFTVLRWMQLHGYYDVRADAALLVELEKSVAAMPDSSERDDAKLDLIELRTGQRPPSERFTASKPRKTPVFTREENRQRVANLLKLMADTSDKEKAAAFPAFFYLRDEQHYDVSSDPEVMGRLETVCAGMKDAALQKLARQYLDALKTGRPQPDEPKPKHEPGPPAIP